MNNFSALLIGMLALYVVLAFLLVVMWRTGFLFMVLNILADEAGKLRRLLSRKTGG
ncbi:hypothetical protein [Stenotrophomonas rhizophila]|uniref:hypothetical protein n=1 Tax=Stenotrophomonas rhizophila TaxID=216778 RepID=UPI00164343E3|nr:hypothetical protein [Stenotrophomonas rhizophila]